MKDKLEKLFEKKAKEGGSMPDHEREAKMDVVKQMKSDMAELMGDKLKGSKKITVASDSKEGLKAGLDKAEQLLAGGGLAAAADDEDHIEKDEPVEDSESPLVEGDELSEEELDEQLARLMAMKKARSK